ncbi:FecR family protein [Pedobacter sp. V48]|uniref:FecR family protein n=1 Tax=Pedobacter sp. V48 TaxID=509635 RepID=UPI00126807ED|nr:FecR family protein [Pedobacter sp. V48]
MNQERLEYLLECYRLKKCSESEMAELDEWFHTYNPGNHDMEAWLREVGGPENLTEQSYTEFSLLVRSPVIINFRKIAAIAAMLLITVAVGYLLNNGPAEMQDHSDVRNVVKTDIGPGGNKAVLVLANGKKIVLNNARLGKLTQQGNTFVSKPADSSISYRGSGAGLTEAALQYNTLYTPRGGKYNLTLADGTQVMLDAASSITFPVSFNGGERRVKVTGQAYFKVAHDAKKPFFVVSKGQLIKDLGTEFNVDAYPDESGVKVTLAEGLVEVGNSGSTVSLVPGQQARATGSHRIEVMKVRVADVVAWKNGWFVFHNEPVMNVMKQAARWYDVDIQYQGQPITKRFGGNISKYKNISELLENLKLTGGINYRIEGRRVTLIN